MNNAVGYAWPAARPNRVVLGTDGIGADMLEESRLAYVRLREDDVLASPDTVWEWLENGYELFPEARPRSGPWNYHTPTARGTWRSHPACVHSTWRSTGEHVLAMAADPGRPRRGSGQGRRAGQRLFERL